MTIMERLGRCIVRCKKVDSSEGKAYKAMVRWVTMYGAWTLTRRDNNGLPERTEMRMQRRIL